jgi:hypothetical protein
MQASVRNGWQISGESSGGKMIRSKARFLIAVGTLAMAVGTGLRLWTHGSYSHFTAGFLIGLAIVFLIFGVVQQRSIRGQ